MHVTLISDILRKPWAIEPSFALNSAPIIEAIITAQKLKSEIPVVQSHNQGFIDNANPDVNYTTAVIEITGPLMKRDQECGPMGMQSIGEMIQSFDKDINIDSIIMAIDSPGGTVDGTAALGKIIKETQKPIVAYIDGQAASAAYWLASQADYIIGENRAEVGSIGVMLSFADMRPKWEKEGVKFHDLFAEQSKDKNRDFLNILGGKYDIYIKEKLNPLADDFINVVKSSRQNVLDTQLTGKMFFSQDVVGSLVDEIGNLDHAIAYANKLVKPKSINFKQMSEFNKDEKSFKSWMQKTFGLTEAKNPVEEERILEVNQKVLDEDKKLQSWEEEKAAMLASFENEKQELLAQITEIKKLPGAKTATVSKKTDNNKKADPYLVEMGHGDFVSQFNEFKKALRG